MGILNSRERIFDTIITLEGRRQIASGKLQAEFYSFSDIGAFYIQDTSPNGAIDGTKRIYLEASNLPQDSITFESDDSGKLVNFKNSSTIIRNGQILLQVTASLGLGKEYLPVQDNTFSSMADSLLSSSLDSYKNCYIIGSPDLFDQGRDQFILSPDNIKFVITTQNPIKEASEVHQGNLETTDGLFIDSRLSHLPNFQFLPPINKYKTGDPTVNLLGNYPNLNQKPQLTFTDVEQKADWAVQRGYSTSIIFEETSRNNNLICQVFEIGGYEISKLDVIDFGLFNVSGDDITLSEKKRQGINPRNTPGITKHVFFVGKVFTDSKGINKFINLFTLIFKD